MDNIDKNILHLLSQNSRMPATEIAHMIGLSIPATNKRIQRLKDNCTINRFTIETNPEHIEKTVSAFVFITISQFRDLPKLIDHIHSKPDILECYAITGEFDYILRVCAKSTGHLEQMLLELKKLDVVVKTNTVIALYTHKYKPVILPDSISNDN
ncbi:MAG TPA: Lrp/AsnC family transcriptional regulator [Bacillota bacterium]|nr:Lrp/AsnC family transcriptional regulator [Bacillota bacterium]